MTLSGGRKHFNYDTQQYEADPNYPVNQASILESRALNLLNITPSTINNSSFINTQFYNLDDADKLEVIDLYNKAIKKRDFLDKKFKDEGHLHYNKKLKSQVNSLATIKKHSTPQSARTRKISEPSAPSVSGRHHRRPSRAIRQVTQTLSFNDDEDDDDDDDHDMGDDSNQNTSIDEVIEWISTINIMGGRKKNKKTKKLKNGGMNRRRSRSRAPPRERSISPQSTRRLPRWDRSLTRRSRTRSRTRSRSRSRSQSRSPSRSRAVSRSPNNKCSICFDHVSKNNKNAFIIDGCNHIFHNNCITPWLDKNTCPNCRKTIDTSRPVMIINSLLANEPPLTDDD